jgi:hypothetical protein
MMNIEGIIYWIFRSAGEFAQWITPLISLGATLLWCRTKDGPFCYVALAGVVVALIGKVTQLFLPDGITWIAQSRIEYIPTGSTTLLKAIAYTSFSYIGMALFVIAIFMHFYRKNSRQ